MSDKQAILIISRAGRPFSIEIVKSEDKSLPTKYKAIAGFKGKDKPQFETISGIGEALVNYGKELFSGEEPDEPIYSERGSKQIISKISEGVTFMIIARNVDKNKLKNALEETIEYYSENWEKVAYVDESSQEFFYFVLTLANIIGETLGI